MIMMMLMMNNYTPGLIDAHEFILLFTGMEVKEGIRIE